MGLVVLWGAVKDRLGFDGTGIGVDIWRGGDIVNRDATESKISRVGRRPDKNMLVVSPIGGQGFILGRGNSQLSPAVMRQCEIQVIGTKAKLKDIDVLRVDTDDTKLDKELRGWMKVQVLFQRSICCVFF